MQKRKTIWITAVLCGALFMGGCSGIIRQTSDITSVADGSETVAETTAEETFIVETAAAESDSTLETMMETEVIEDPIVIVLDPGHDDEYCVRSHPNLGVNEQELNLTIAMACRDRLEQYEGIEVYLTREDGSCPDAEHNGEYCIEVRTGYAADVDADLFVSIHNNGTTGLYGAEANGAEVYVSNYSAYTEEGKKLGQMILDNLSELDLYPKGVFVRTKEEKGYYDDGSVQDWYYLISYSVEGGRPGIIIEHAYMDNPHDNEILKDEEKLKQMGIADADAIAAYYGLHLKE